MSTRWGEVGARQLGQLNGNKWKLNLGDEHTIEYTEVEIECFKYEAFTIIMNNNVF